MDDPFVRIQIGLVLGHSILEGGLLPEEVLELKGLTNRADHGLRDLVPLLVGGGVRLRVAVLGHGVGGCG